MIPATIYTMLEFSPAMIVAIVNFFMWGIFGMALHIAKRFARRTTPSVGLFQYLRENRNYTILSTCTYIATFVTLITSGIDFTTLQSMGTIFQTGYMVNSLITKDEAGI